MAIIEQWPNPVNPAQVLEATGATGCTVLANDAEGTWDVVVDGAIVPDVIAALRTIVYDPAAGLAVVTPVEKLASVGLTPADLLTLVEQAKASGQ